MLGALLKGGTAARPVFGARYLDLTRAIGGKSAPARGALLAPSAAASAVTPGGPAALAGLRSGDVVTAVNGEEVSAKSALADLLAQYSPGDTVALTVLRAGKEVRADVMLAPSK
jgi:S1-C subfamily serine protease